MAGSVWTIQMPPSSCRLIAKSFGSASTNVRAPNFTNRLASLLWRASWASVASGFRNAL